MNGADRKSFLTVMLAAGMIFPAALFFAFVADLPHVLVLVAFGLLASMVITRPVEANDRSIIYFSVMTVVLAVLLDYMFPMKNDRFGFIGIFFHPEISVPIALYAAVFLTFFKSGPYVTGGAAAAALFTLMFAGDVYNLNIPNERLPMLTPMIKHFSGMFTFIITVNLFLILLSFRVSESQKTGRGQQDYLWRKRLVLAAIFLLLPLCIAGGWKLYKMNEDGIRRLENFFMQHSIRRMMQPVKHTVFDREVDLNRTFNDDMVKNQNIIVLRVVSACVPGYLRGHAYTDYRGGRWQETGTQNARQLKSKTYSGMLAFKTFFFETDRRENFAFEVLPSKEFTSKVLLTPANVKQFDIIASRLTCTRDGVFEPQDWEKDGGYTAFTPRAAIESAWQEPDAAAAREYLELPPDIARQLDVIAGDIPELKKLKQPAGDAATISALLKFFSSNFTYKLSAQNAGSADPVIHFLTKTRAGHCELFASAMALLLREKGIPARYVTGFVCEERHPSGKYYVSRLGNAHAWLEAYDRDLKKWVMLEPTPPSGIPNFKHEMGSWESFSDRFQKFFQQLLSDLRRGYFAKIITDTGAAVYELFAAMFFDPVRGPVSLLLFIAALIIYIRHRKSRRNRHKNIAELHKNVVELSREYVRLSNLLKKRYNLEIQADTTVAELAKMIMDLKLEPAEVRRISEVLNEYQQLRFRELPPTDKELHQAKQRLVQAIR